MTAWAGTGCARGVEQDPKPRAETPQVVAPSETPPPDVGPAAAPESVGPELLVFSRSFDTPTAWVVPRAEYEALGDNRGTAFLDRYPAYTSMQALALAHPDLHARVEPLPLAGALASLHGHHTVRAEHTFAELTKDVYPTSEDVLTKDAWRMTYAIVAPDPATLNDPVLEHGVLTSDELTEVEGFHSADRHPRMAGVRATYTFGSDGWTRAVVALPTALRPPTAAQAAIVAAFGGPVAGFVGHGDAAGRVLIGIEVGPAASRYVHIDPSKATEGYATWSELAAAHPHVVSAPFITKLSNALLRELAEHAGSTIEDPARWLAEYEAEGRARVDTFGYDQGKRPRTTTLYTIADPSLIRGPEIDELDILRVTTESSGSRQPFATTVDLRTLRYDTAPPRVPLATGKVVHHDGEGLEPQRELAPPPPRRIP